MAESWRGILRAGQDAVAANGTQTARRPAAPPRRPVFIAPQAVTKVTYRRATTGIVPGPHPGQGPVPARRRRCSAMSATTVRRAGLLSAGLLALACAAPRPAGAASWLDISDFTGTCGTTLVCAGAAAEHGTAMRLVPPSPDQAGAVWAPTSLATGQDFVATFSFRLGEGANGWRADGLAFVLAADPNGLGDATRYGGSMGFEGLGRSIAVEFDTFDNGQEPGDNHVAVSIDGVLANLAAGNPYGTTGCDAAGTPFCLSNGDVWTATVAYDAAAGEMSVSVRDGVAAADQVIAGFSFDLKATVGHRFHMGISAGTGGGYMAHDLLSWSVEAGPRPVAAAASTAAIPEPAGAALLGTALATLGLLRRRL